MLIPLRTLKTNSGFSPAPRARQGPNIKAQPFSAVAAPQNHHNPAARAADEGTAYPILSRPATPARNHHSVPNVSASVQREDLMRLRSCIRLIAAFLFALPVYAQNQPDTLSATLLHEDAIFWDAYNRCDVQKMSQFFWPDAEFYHDQGGPTIGLDALTETFKKNLCGNPNFRLRREALPATIKIFPLQKNGVTYGAVFTGEHYFYINDNGKPEFRDGWAKFFHLWLLKDGTWKIARVVSYDHQAAPPENQEKRSHAPSHDARAVRWHICLPEERQPECFSQ